MMNSKIREFAEKAGFFPVPDETEWDWEYRAENARYEKFVELIIRECVEVVNNHFESKEPGYPGDKIEQHFGID